jgi:hypothetical protein
MENRDASFIDPQKDSKKESLLQEPDFQYITDGNTSQAVIADNSAVLSGLVKEHESMIKWVHDQFPMALLMFLMMSLLVMTYQQGPEYDGTYAISNDYKNGNWSETVLPSATNDSVAEIVDSQNKLIKHRNKSNKNLRDHESWGSQNNCILNRPQKINSIEINSNLVSEKNTNCIDIGSDTGFTLVNIPISNLDHKLNLPDNNGSHENWNSRGIKWIYANSEEPNDDLNLKHNKEIKNKFLALDVYISGNNKTNLKLNRNMLFHIDCIDSMIVQPNKAYSFPEKLSSQKKLFADSEPLDPRFNSGALLYRIGKRDSWKSFVSANTPIFAERSGILEFAINLKSTKNIKGYFRVKVFKEFNDLRDKK